MQLAVEVAPKEGLALYMIPGAGILELILGFGALKGVVVIYYWFIRKFYRLRMNYLLQKKEEYQSQAQLFYNYHTQYLQQYNQQNGEALRPIMTHNIRDALVTLLKAA
jgi:hypothetical protein